MLVGELAACRHRSRCRHRRCTRRASRVIADGAVRIRVGTPGVCPDCRRSRSCARTVYARLCGCVCTGICVGRARIRSRGAGIGCVRVRPVCWIHPISSHSICTRGRSGRWVCCARTGGTRCCLRSCSPDLCEYLACAKRDAEA
jgi:hypothetical protein